MPIINLKATSEKKGNALVIIAYIFIFMNILLMAIIDFLFHRTSEEYMRLFPLESMELKSTSLLLLLCHMSILITGFVLYVYDNGSYGPARNPGLVLLEQSVPIDRNNAKGAATQDAVGNKKLQQYSMPLTLDRKDDKDDEATAAAPEQLTDADTLSSLYTAPLTEENLQALDKAMQLKKGTGAGAMTASSAESINRALYGLKFTNIQLEHKDAKERGKELIQEARRIFNGPRLSEMGVPQSESLSETASSLSLDDELTFLAGLWNLLIGKHRTVKHMDINDKLVFVDIPWEEDYLKCNWSSPFAANVTPPLRYADLEREPWISYVPKFIDSVPSLTYGYQEVTFTPDQMNANDTINGEICRRGSSFLIVEAESIDLPFLRGVAQTLRAAAATINLKRKLLEEAKSPVIADSSNIRQHSTGVADSSASTFEGDTTPAIPDPSSSVPEPTSGQYRYKADMSSFIFTFVSCPEIARLCVVWAEERGKKRART